MATSSSPQNREQRAHTDEILLATLRSARIARRMGNAEQGGNKVSNAMKMYLEYVYKHFPVLMREGKRDDGAALMPEKGDGMYGLDVDTYFGRAYRGEQSARWEHPYSSDWRTHEGHRRYADEVVEHEYRRVFPPAKSESPHFQVNRPWVSSLSGHSRRPYSDALPVAKRNPPTPFRTSSNTKSFRTVTFSCEGTEDGEIIEPVNTPKKPMQNIFSCLEMELAPTRISDEDWEDLFKGDV
ncbi:hypothetical protein N0V90_001190 [Kalmusia sp. IMI 367209]|nr:hypothetical protein N0V90_001190 [Kalmusia sp. IMI 367209]